MVSVLKDWTVLNRYVEWAKFYELYRGNYDPEIEFSTEFSLSDYSDAELRKAERIKAQFLSEPPTLEALNAVPWMLERSKSRIKSLK